MKKKTSDKKRANGFEELLLDAAMLGMKYSGEEETNQEGIATMFVCLCALIKEAHDDIMKKLKEFEA